MVVILNMVEVESGKIKLSEINFAEYNPREISDNELDNLKNSIEYYGLIEPIIINNKNNTIVGGHQRSSALLAANPDEELSFIRLGDISILYKDEDIEIPDEQHEKGMNLSLNRLKGNFNIIKLEPLLNELAELGYGELTGFDIELDDVDYSLEPVDDGSESEGEFVYSDDNLDIGLVDDTDNDKVVVEPYEPINVNSEEDKDKEEDIVSSNKEESEPEQEPEHFVEKGDIWKIGNNIILYDDEYNDKLVDILLNSYEDESVSFDDDLIKSDSFRVPLKYYIVEDVDLIEKHIRKNYKFSEKIMTRRD